MFKDINKVDYKIAVVIGTIFLVLSLKSLMYLYIATKLSPTLKDKLSIGRQPQPSRGNKLHGMQCGSYILNGKVEWFRPGLHGVKALNSVRFESNAATPIYISKTYRSLSLVQEHIVNCNPSNSEVIVCYLTKKLLYLKKS